MSSKLTPMYCSKCGERLVDTFRPIGLCDTETGKPLFIVRSTCPQHRLKFLFFGNGHIDWVRGSYYLEHHTPTLYFEDGTSI